MIAALLLGFLLGVGSVFMSAWVRMRVLDRRVQQTLMELRHADACVAGATVVQLMKREPRAIPPDEVA